MAEAPGTDVDTVPPAEPAVPEDLVFTTPDTVEAPPRQDITFKLDGKVMVARRPTDSVLTLIIRMGSRRATRYDQVDGIFSLLDHLLTEEDREHIYARMQDRDDPLSRNPQPIFDLVVALAKIWTNAGAPNRAERRRKR